MSEEAALFSSTVPRQLKHRRRVFCEGYAREDGRWDVDARLLDTRGYALTVFFNQLLPVGEPLHQMGLRMTVDGLLVVCEVQALTLHGPAPECRAIAPVYQQLVGLRIGPGFSARVRDLFKGTAGCTHLTELLGVMATVAFQTVLPPGGPEGSASKDDPPPTGLIDSCHAFRSDGEVVLRRWPQHRKPG